MAKVERGVIKPPNQELQGLTATRSHTPRADTPASRRPNSKLHAGDPGGSADLTRQPSPVVAPGHRFNVDDARMPQPPAAIEPGKGAVPVDPIGLTSAGIDAIFANTTVVKPR
jgi:hypothetical protein